MSDTILEMRSITKTFPGVKALQDVSLRVRRGEIHAICGENGAGKSTLMKVLSGVYPAGTYEGEIVVDGHRYSEDDLLASIDAGAEDVSLDGDLWEIVTGPGELAGVRAALEAAGVQLESAELVMRPTTRTPVEEGQVASLMRLIEGLDDHDYVQTVHANFDVDADVLERVAAV